MCLHTHARVRGSEAYAVGQHEDQTCACGYNWATLGPQVVNRTRVARTRLTQDEYDAYLLRSVEAGFANPSEYLRSLVVGQADLQSVLSRIANLERRLEHV